MRLDYGKSRRSELSVLAARQKRDDDALLKKLPPKARRVLVDNSRKRPALEAALASFGGLVQREVRCSCGTVITARVPLGETVHCAKCGKGA